MNKSLLAIPVALLSWLLAAPMARASSLEVIIGRYYLAQSNLPYANTIFASAQDPEGKVLGALTSLAMLQREPNTVGFVNRFHYTSPTNIWQVRTTGYPKSPTRPFPYRTTSGTRGAQLVSILRDIHGPVLAQAETDLANFTDNAQLVPLGRSETGYPDISLDRGDVLMVRSLLACGRALIKLANSQNVDVVFNDYLLLEEEPGPVTIEKILSRFPDLAKLATAADLPVARQEAKIAIDLYKQASNYIRSSRPLGVVRLFNLPGSFGVQPGELYTASLLDEAKFRAKLDEYAALMDGQAAITGFDDGLIDTFNGKPFFDGFLDCRNILPSFRKNKIRQGHVTDSFAKAGGVYPGNTVSKTENYLLSETLSCAYDPFAYGLFVPPRLTISSTPQDALLENYQPQNLFLALGWLWGGSGNRYSDAFGLYWVNPTTKEFSKLIKPVISYGEWVQAASVQGEHLIMITRNFMTYPEQYKIVVSRLSDGSALQSHSLSLDNFYVYEYFFTNADLVLWGNFSQTPWGLGFFKVNLITGISSGPFYLDSSYSAATLDETKTHILAAKINYNPPEYSQTWVIDKIRLSDGQKIQSIPMNGSLSNPNKILCGKDNNLYAFSSDWSSWPARLTLTLIDLNNQTISLLNSNILPSGRINQGSPSLEPSGIFAVIQSTDLNWQGLAIHKVRLSDGVLIDSHQVGKPGDEFWFDHLWVAPGALLFATRNGDVSEEVAVTVNVTGNAQNGLDYLLSEPLPLIFRPGNIEQPINFNIIDDATPEFTKTVTFAGTPDPVTEATFQIFTLTIIDDDGTGVGIFATDNQGKEGRMSPDPFGFRFGSYDPIRFEVRRTGSTANALSVKVNRNLLLSSATPDDYQITGLDVDGQSIRIPAGQSAAEIVVSPKYDLEYPEGTESLVLKINPDPSYALTESISASSTILDTSIYEWWSYQMGLLVANHPPSLDADADGMPNLLEMALGRDPNLPDSANSVQEGRDAEGYLTLTFKRWSGGVTAPDGTYTVYGVSYQPQATSSLESPIWSSSSIETRSIIDTGDGLEQVTIRDNLSKSEPRRFLRLQVTMTE
jgi:membrane-bound inhibitor of C-type lysozyme